MRSNIFFFILCIITLFSSSMYVTNIYAYNTNDIYENFVNNKYYWWKNNNILNMAPYLSVNGLDNRNIDFFINGIQYKFLNTQLNSSNFINPYFVSKMEQNNHFSKYEETKKSINLIEAKDFFITESNNLKQGYVLNSLVSYPNFSNNTNLIGFYKNPEINLLLGVNYIYLTNAFEHNFSQLKSLPSNNYNSIIAVEYTPADKYSSLKFINLNTLSNSQRDIYFNKEAQTYFNQDIILQKGESNISILSYKSMDPNNLLWNYSSNILFGIQMFNIGKSSGLIKSPSVAYNNFSYNAQNISKLNLLHNNLKLIYGIDYSKVITNSCSTTNQYYWGKGKEDNYKIYLKGDIDILNTGKIHILPELSFDYAKYKANGLHSYKQKGILPSISMHIYPIPYLTLYGKYFYNKRLPHIYEKYIDGKYFYNDNFVKFKPNTNLKNEKNTTFKSGIIYDYVSNTSVVKVSADINVFLSKVNNYIDYSFINYNEVQYTNVSNASLKGYEANFLLQLYNLNLNMGYIYINGVDESGDYLMNLYPSKFVMNTSYSFSTIDLKTGIKIKTFSNFNRFNKNYPNYSKIKGYTLFDAYVEYKALNKKLFLEIGIENLFNKKYNLPYINTDYKDRTYFFKFSLKL